MPAVRRAATMHRVKAIGRAAPVLADSPAAAASAVRRAATALMGSVLMGSVLMDRAPMERVPMAAVPTGLPVKAMMPLRATSVLGRNKSMRDEG
jgi:hypothetical protein